MPCSVKILHSSSTPCSTISNRCGLKPKRENEIIIGPKKSEPGILKQTNDKRKSQLHTNITFDLFISIAVMSDYRSFFSCPHSHFNSFHHFWCGQLQNVFFCLLAGRTKCRILIEMSPDRSHTSTQLSPKMNRNLHF